MAPLVPAKPQTPAVMKKVKWEDKQISQVLAKMPRNAEVAFGGRENIVRRRLRRV